MRRSPVNGSRRAVLPVHGDLTDPEAVTRIVGEIRAAFGQIDILVTVAGGD